MQKILNKILAICNMNLSMDQNKVKFIWLHLMQESKFNIIRKSNNVILSKGGKLYYFVNKCRKVFSIIEHLLTKIFLKYKKKNF